MAVTAGGRKGRAIAGLMGLSPQRYFSPARIAEIVGCAVSRISEVRTALANSEDPQDREVARRYKAAADAVGHGSEAGQDTTKRRNR